MAEKKPPTHYAAAHHVGPFPKGSVFTAEELDAAIGVEKDATDEAKAKARSEGVQRLLRIGAITPAAAPEAEEHAPEPAATPQPPGPSSPRPAAPQPPAPAPPAAAPKK